jgi:hypothetical protein
LKGNNANLIDDRIEQFLFPFNLLEILDCVEVSERPIDQNILTLTIPALFLLLSTENRLILIGLNSPYLR